MIYRRETAGPTAMMQLQTRYHGVGRIDPQVCHTELLHMIQATLNTGLSIAMALRLCMLYGKERYAFRRYRGRLMPRRHLRPHRRLFCSMEDISKSLPYFPGFACLKRVFVEMEILSCSTWIEAVGDVTALVRISCRVGDKHCCLRVPFTSTKAPAFAVFIPKMRYSLDSRCSIAVIST